MTSTAALPDALRVGEGREGSRSKHPVDTVPNEQDVCLSESIRQVAEVQFIASEDRVPTWGRRHIRIIANSGHVMLPREKRFLVPLRLCHGSLLRLDVRSPNWPRLAKSIALATSIMGGGRPSHSGQRDGCSQGCSGGLRFCDGPRLIAVGVFRLIAAVQAHVYVRVSTQGVDHVLGAVRANVDTCDNDVSRSYEHQTADDEIAESGADSKLRAKQHYHAGPADGEHEQTAEREERTDRPHAPKHQISDHSAVIRPP